MPAVKVPAANETPALGQAPASPTNAGQAAPTQASAAANAAPAATPFIGQIALEPKSGPPSTEVIVRGTGLPRDTSLQLNWNTADGSWLLAGDYNEQFKGRQFKDRAEPQGTIKTDGQGNFQARFKVPEGWGFDHDVTVVDPATGKVVTKTNFTVDMQVDMLSHSGPPGSPITFEVRGMGYRSMENSWVAIYDNKVTGWIASITTGGNVRFTIPAAGSPGKHPIVISHGWSSVMYLNPSQTPAPGRRLWNFEYTVTDGAPVLPPPLASQGLKPEVGAPPPGTGPALWTDPATGPIGTPLKLMGRGLTPGATVDIDWWRMSGNRIAGQGWSEKSIGLGQAKVGADGSIALEIKAPDDLGGAHRIEARTGETVLAKGSYTITPSVIALEPARGPVGTDILIHLKGVGWTETANIYTLTYDNAYVGFGCGFNSQGDVKINLPASGQPGWHFIDLYPAIYKGTDLPGAFNFRYPMLTGELEHPGERLPIFRLAFYVTS